MDPIGTCELTSMANPVHTRFGHVVVRHGESLQDCKCLAYPPGSQSSHLLSPKPRRSEAWATFTHQSQKFYRLDDTWV